MKKHKPNFIDLRSRILCAVLSMILIFYVVAELAIGYTFLPGKRGGILLSGIPTLLIAAAVLLVSFASLLTLIDHYDKRPNEQNYKSLKRIFFIASLYFFIAAPFIELMEQILIFNGILIFPPFHGFAEKYTFYSPALNRYAALFIPITNNAVTIALISFLIGGCALFLDRNFPNNVPKLKLLLIFVSVLGISGLGLAESFEAFFSGQASYGRQLKYLVKASDEPAKFNAVLLTYFIFSSLGFLSSSIGIIAISVNRLKLAANPSLK